MLPGVDFTEMLLVAVIAVVVFGPRDLPLMMRKFGRFTGKMRSMAFEFKQGFDELGRQAELEELRKEVADLKKHTGIDEFREELEADKRALEADVRSTMSDPRKDAPVMTGPTPVAEPASYAGLSADHPGYDVGEEPRVDAPALAEPEPAMSAKVEPGMGDAPEGEKAGDPHIVPDDDVRPAHPAAKAAGAKQSTPA